MSARRRITGLESDSDNISIVTIPDDSDNKKYKKSWNYPKGNIEQLPEIGNNNQQDTTSVRDLLIFDQETKEELIVMTSRDRTFEFSNAIRSLQGRNITRAVNIKDPRKVKQLQSYSEFMLIAKNIGKNIASTYTKLEKLTLCK